MLIVIYFDISMLCFSRRALLFGPYRANDTDKSQNYFVANPLTQERLMADHQKVTLPMSGAEKLRAIFRDLMTIDRNAYFNPPRYIIDTPLIFAALVFIVIFCVLFVDRPVAFYFSRHRELLPLFQLFAAPSLLTGPAAGLFLVYATGQWLRGAGRVNQIWLAMSVARLAGAVTKNALQYLFGRPWPETWLQSGAYQFHPFTDNAFYGSMPSGHTTFIAAPICVLWVLVPQLRWVWAGLTGLVMLGLVGGNYHFVADVVAGLLTGMICAWGSLMVVRPLKQ